MATMSISLTEPLKQFVDDEIREGGFASTSDYMRDLIRQRQHRKAEETQRALITEGMVSGPAVPMEPNFFNRMRERLREKLPS